MIHISMFAKFVAIRNFGIFRLSSLSGRTVVYQIFIESMLRPPDKIVN